VKCNFDTLTVLKNARDEKPILPTSTNLCITGSSGTQRAKQLHTWSCRLGSEASIVAEGMRLRFKCNQSMDGRKINIESLAIVKEV
jgi:hypothetical protein